MSGRVIEYRIDEAPLPRESQIDFAQRGWESLQMTHRVASLCVLDLNPWSLANEPAEFRA